MGTYVGEGGVCRRSICPGAGLKDPAGETPVLGRRRRGEGASISRCGRSTRTTDYRRAGLGTADWGNRDYVGTG
jgi:hypothetical protein